MLSVRSVLCFYIFTCLTGASLIVPNLQSTSFLSMCVDEIQEKYFKPCDYIIVLNLNENFRDLQLNLASNVVQTNYAKELINFRLAKADVYVIITSETFIRNIFKSLAISTHWNPRARFVIILDGNPTDLFLILSKYYVFNAVALVPKSEDETEILTYFPYNFFVSQSERTKAVMLTVCLEGKLQKEVKLFPPKLPEKWNNITLRIILMEYPPYVSCHGCDDKDKKGIELQVLRLMQSVLGFRVEYVNKSYKEWGQEQTKGLYSGAYRDLQRHNADVGIGFFFANFAQSWDFDLSFPYMEDAFQWVVPAAKLQPHWMGLVRIFGLYIWISVLTLLVVISLFLHLSATFLPERKSYLVISTCFLVCFQCWLGQCVHLMPRTSTIRFVLIAWVFFTYLIVSAFQSHLTSALNFNTYEKQISTVQELIDSGLEFGFYHESGNLFLYTPSKTDSFIYKHRIICPLGIGCLNRTAFQGDFATIKIKRNLQVMITRYYLEPNGRPMVYIFEDKACQVLIVMAFSKGFPMFERINQLLFNIRSSGFIAHIYERQENSARRAYSKAQVRQNANNLTFGELQGIFGLLLIGWLLSLTVFTAELAFSHIRMLKNKAAKKR